MAADFTIKAGDSQPVLTDTLTYSDGTAVDLTGATLAFVMRAQTAASPLTLTGLAEITGASSGAVSYTFTAADSGGAGNYMANWAVTFPDGSLMTFPTIGYLSIRVEENITTVGGQQLVSLPDVKDYLSLDPHDRTHDAKLVRFIEACRPLIEEITGPIVPQVFEEWHTGGQTFIVLQRRPSRAMGTSPVLDLISCSEYRGPTEYPLKIVQDPAHGDLYSVHLDPRSCTVTRRTSGGGLAAFPAQPEAVRVFYRAGQQTVPPNVYEATLELVRVNYQTTQSTGRGRRTVSDDLDASGPALGFFVPRRVRELLGPNRRAPSIA